MKYSVLTLFPDLVRGWTGDSLIAKAIEKEIISVDVLDIRSSALDKHRVVDDNPYGGGAGMVMRVDVVVRAIESAVEKNGPADEVILLSPAGEPLTQKTLEELSSKKHLLLVCGRYEGIDARVEKYVTREISIGDYVLMGGELGALVLLEGTSRLVPGVIKEADSHIHDSFSTGILDHPHFTRPAEFRGQGVPEVLANGHHAKIIEWQRKQALLRTKKRRPDLLHTEELTPKEQYWLDNEDPEFP